MVVAAVARWRGGNGGAPLAGWGPEGWGSMAALRTDCELAAAELHRDVLDRLWWQREDRAAVEVALALRAAQHHPSQQHLQRVECGILAILPRPADDVPPEAVLEASPKGRHAQKIQLAYVHARGGAVGAGKSGVVVAWE